jgi:sugar lactone lactonase YvrE
LSGSVRHGSASILFEPASLAIDGAVTIYVADGDRILRVTRDGWFVEILADGLSVLAGIAVDGAGNVYVTERERHRVLKVAPDGTVTTLAGSGERGFQDGPAMEARFQAPAGLAADGAGNVYVADSGNHCIPMVSPDGVVSTLAVACEPW